MKVIVLVSFGNIQNDGYYRAMIKESCCCGATFEVSSRGKYPDISEQYRYNEFLKAHTVCREKQPTYCLNGDLEKLENLYSGIKAKIKELKKENEV